MENFDPSIHMAVVPVYDEENQQEWLMSLEFGSKEEYIDYLKSKISGKEYTLVNIEWELISVLSEEMHFLQ